LALTYPCILRLNSQSNPCCIRRSDREIAQPMVFGQSTCLMSQNERSSLLEILHQTHQVSICVGRYFHLLSFRVHLLPLFHMDDLQKMMSLWQRAKASTEGCTLATCSVSLSVYGYLPNKPLNLTFLAIFAISFIGHVVFGIRRRVWSFLVALGIGTLLEAIGKGTRRNYFCALTDPRLLRACPDARRSVQARIVCTIVVC